MLHFMVEAISIGFVKTTIINEAFILLYLELGLLVFRDFDCLMPSTLLLQKKYFCIFFFNCQLVVKP